MPHRVFKTVASDFRRIPNPIKRACFSAAIFTAGWGFADCFFAILLAEIGSGLALVGLLSSFYAFIALLLAIPVGELDGRANQKHILALGKIIYIFAGIFYFLAGYFKSIPLLVIALLANGIGNPLVYVTYNSYIRQRSSKHNSSRVFGLYAALTNLSWCGAMVLTSFLVIHFGVPLLFLFIPLFAALSLLSDLKLPACHNKTVLQGISDVVHKDHVYKRVFKHIRKMSFELIFTFILQFFWGVLDFVAFIYIPILALRENYSLSQVALIMAFMYVPYFFSFFFAEIADKKERMNILAISFITAALFIAALFGLKHPHAIYFLCFSLAICLAIIRPTLSGIITNLAPRGQRSEISGIQTFFTRSGAIVGSLLFGVFSQMFGLGHTFLGLAIITSLVGSSIFWVKDYCKTKELLGKLNEAKGFHNYHPEFAKVNSCAKCRGEEVIEESEPTSVPAELQ
ncbi:MAG TPA: MFS transporter [Candidatus Peregrinibacteria bacterium]|nr:MFS transporter [Candidatus Peregrinibacteria bacterium]